MHVGGYFSSTMSSARYLSVWDPQPESRSPAGPDPPWPKGGTIRLTYELLLLK